MLKTKPVQLFKKCYLSTNLDFYKKKKISRQGNKYNYLKLYLKNKANKQKVQLTFYQKKYPLLQC